MGSKESPLSPQLPLHRTEPLESPPVREESLKPPVHHDDLSRRSLLLAGSTLLGATAISYARVPGANDRICLGHIGVGNRGRELASVVAGLKSSSQRRDDGRLRSVESESRARGQDRRATNTAGAPSSFQYVEDLLAVKDVDAVIISTADFQHAPLLRLAAEAGKDAYCEKPMANDLR